MSKLQIPILKLNIEKKNVKANLIYLINKINKLLGLNYIYTKLTNFNEIY